MTTTDRARPPVATSRSTWNPWDDVEKLTFWLNDSNGLDEHEITLRIMKIGEEFGEAVEARIGQIGQNPRKGVTHTEADVIAELCDVIVTAMVAINTLTGDPVVSRGHLAAKFAKLLARVEAMETADVR